MSSLKFLKRHDYGLLHFPGTSEARVRTPSPKHHRALTPQAGTGSGSESDGDEDRREVRYDTAEVIIQQCKPLTFIV